MDKKLIDEWKKLNNVLIGTTKGGRNNQIINFTSDGRTISVKCFGDVAAGEAIALRSDDGQWYVTSSQKRSAKSEFRKEIEFRKTKVRKRQEPNPFGFVMWLDCNWLQRSDIANNAQFAKELFNIFNIDDVTKIYTQPRETIYVQGSNVYGILPNSSFLRPLPILKDIAEGKTIVEIVFSATDASEVADGIVVACLQPSEIFFTELELDFLRDAAINYTGVVVLGEWRSWEDYDNVILQKLTGGRIAVSESFATNTWTTLGSSQLEITDNLTIETNATAAFDSIGLQEQEKLAFDPVGRGATVVYVAPEDMGV